MVARNPQRRRKITNPPPALQSAASMYALGAAVAAGAIAAVWLARQKVKQESPSSPSQTSTDDSDPNREQAKGNSRQNVRVVASGSPAKSVGNSGQVSSQSPPAPGVANTVERPQTSKQIEQIEALLDILDGWQRKFPLTAGKLGGEINERMKLYADQLKFLLRNSEILIGQQDSGDSSSNLENQEAIIATRVVKITSTIRDVLAKKDEDAVQWQNSLKRVKAVGRLIEADEVTSLETKNKRQATFGELSGLYDEIPNSKVPNELDDNEAILAHLSRIENYIKLLKNISEIAS